MWTRNRTRLAIAALFTAVAACGDDDGTSPATDFEAQLSGDEEVPPVVTSATGSATLSIEGSVIAYRVEVTNLANAIVSHIHVAPSGENGPIRLDLCGTGDPLPACTSGTGVLAEGENGTTQGISFDSLVSAIRAGNAYVNIHTDDGEGEQNTGEGDMISGEIRGQITAQ